MLPSSNSISPPAATLYPPPAHTGNPYLDAQEVWDRRTGSYLAWIRRLLWCLALMAIAVVVLVGYAIFTPGKTEYLPYIVEVSDVGQVRTVGIVPRGWQAESKAPIDFVVRLWLQGVRSVVDSPIAWGMQWDQAKSFMTTKVMQQLSEFAKERDGIQKMNQTVEIEITSVLPHDTNWQLIAVEWTEKTYSQQGVRMKPPESWKAHLQVAIFPPQHATLKTPAQFRNTLGVYVVGYQWGLKTTPKPGMAGQGGS